MSDYIESDASLLWSDVLDLLQEQDISPAVMAMLQAVKPLSLDEEGLKITTTRFAKRRIQAMTSTLEDVIEQVAFEKIPLILAESETPQIKLTNEMSVDEFKKLANTNKPMEDKQSPLPSSVISAIDIAEDTPAINHQERRSKNPLLTEIGEGDSKLTFERFIKGDENGFAFEAAKQVANGGNSNYKNLFIWGKSGLGKTHLLKAIQNYIARNDPSRLCLYRTAKDFQTDYITAMQNKEYAAQEALRRNYYDIDVLIIDDIQNLSGNGTIQFFFDAFNYLAQQGKWVVIAADRKPAELGLGDKALDERVVSRLGQGLIIPIEVPSQEFKYILIKNFYQRMKEDAQAEHTPGYTGVLTDEQFKLMAEKSGNNIRMIAGFVSECLLISSEHQNAGLPFGREDILKIAAGRWNQQKVQVTIPIIKKFICQEFNIDIDTLIGAKRTKEIAVVRHKAIYLCRELTDETLEEIGKQFGKRSHATVLSSVNKTEESMKTDRLLYDEVRRLKETLLSGVVE